MDDATYSDELRAQLAARVWPPERVRDAVAEVESTCALSGCDAGDVFGPAAALDAAWRTRDGAPALRVAAVVVFWSAALLAACTVASTLVALLVGDPIVMPLPVAAGMPGAMLLAACATRVRRRRIGAATFVATAWIVPVVISVAVDAATGDQGVRLGMGVALAFGAAMATVTFGIYALARRAFRWRAVPWFNP